MEKVYCVFLTMSKEMCGEYRGVQRLEGRRYKFERMGGKKVGENKVCENDESANR